MHPSTTQVTTQSSRTSLKRGSLFRWIAILLLAMIVIVGIIILIIWLVVKPKSLIYTLENGSVHNFNLANDHLNSTFDFVIRAYNPNGRASIYYDKIEVSVVYDDQTVGFNTLLPYHQPTRNVTRLDTKLVAHNVALSSSTSKELAHEKSSGSIELDVRVKAKIRFKVGIWKSGHNTIRILCSPAIVHFSSSKGFQRAYCDVDT